MPDCETRLPFFAAVVLAVLCSAGAQAKEVQLQVTETDGRARSPALITTGVPFGRGEVKDVERLAISVGGKALPAQFIKIAPWDDGSVRWALLDTQVSVPAGGKITLIAADGGKNPAPLHPVAVEDGAVAVKVSTGPLQFTVNKKQFNLFQSLKVDGKEMLTSAGRGLVVYREGSGEVAAGPPSEVKIEHAGPMRATVCLRGKFPGVHQDLLGYTVRVTAYAGQKLVKIHSWLENHGAMGYHRGKDESSVSPNIEWFAFRGMALEMGLGLGSSITARCEGVEAADNFKVYQTCRMTHGQEKKSEKKGPFYTWSDFEYAISSADKELKAGERTDGMVELRGGAATREARAASREARSPLPLGEGQGEGEAPNKPSKKKGAAASALTPSPSPKGRGEMCVAIRDFWQNYEKAIELDGKALKLWLWPTEGQWPRRLNRSDLRNAGLFDKTLETLPKDKLYLLPGGVHKGHEILLDFSGRDSRETAAELASPLWALASAEHYAATEATPGLFAPPEARTGDKDCDTKLASWLRMTRSAADPESAAGLFRARQVSVESNVSYFVDSSYWFGWMDFGDLPVPGRGQVGLHYDWTWIMLLSALRTGDMNFVRLAAPMARHRIDVDQLWSDRDPPEVRGLQRGDLNFPAFHCYRLYRLPTVETNWLAGVALWYMLTGEPKAFECCQRNAEGLKAGWAHVAKTKPWAGPQNDMAANAWGMASYCAMYKLTGDRKWLDEGLGLFRTNVIAKRKSLGPFLHDAAHQIQSQDYIQEDMKYCYALASFCELQHLTGDEDLMKLLQEGCQQDFPDSFFEAPFFLSDLYAYVGHKTDNADYVKKAADLFAQAFPESKCPPVFLPDNSVWSRTSAMMLRTGHLLQYANWKQAAK
jgi:hypothetical protein